MVVSLNQKRLFLILLILFAASMVSLQADDVPLSVVAVQWKMQDRYIYDQDLFFSDAEAAVREGLSKSQGDSTSPSLIIFPEYTSVFLTLDTYAASIKGQDGFLEAWDTVQKLYGYTSIQDMFCKESHAVYQKLSIWQEIARRNHCYIIPGTFFVYDPAIKHLVNRWVLIAPDGSIIHYQDKVFCTPFETKYCGVEGSTVAAAYPIKIAGKKIAVTICRDTFFDQWDAHFGSVDLWIDIKANGAVFDAKEQETFTHGVLERITKSRSSYGLTLCLTGSFLDLFWEGRSTLITQQGDVLESSKSVDDYDLFSFVIP